MSVKSKYLMAVGLRYGGKLDEVPTLSVNEENLAADEVVRIARRFGIPVMERPALSRALHSLETEAEVPEHLFEAVAAVLHEIEVGSRRG